MRDFWVTLSIYWLTHLLISFLSNYFNMSLTRSFIKFARTKEQSMILNDSFIHEYIVDFKHNLLVMQPNELIDFCMLTGRMQFLEYPRNNIIQLWCENSIRYDARDQKNLLLFGRASKLRTPNSRFTLLNSTNYKLYNITLSIF